MEWLDGDTDDTFKALDQLRKKRQPVLPPVREKGTHTHKVFFRHTHTGWQLCHGTCIGVDKARQLFCARVSHDVWWEGNIIVSKVL